MGWIFSFQISLFLLGSLQLVALFGRALHDRQLAARSSPGGHNVFERRRSRRCHLLSQHGALRKTASKIQTGGRIYKRGKKRTLCRVAAVTATFFLGGITRAVAIHGEGKVSKAIAVQSPRTTRTGPPAIQLAATSCALNENHLPPFLGPVRVLRTDVDADSPFVAFFPLNP
jgi:hypothetical protein